MSNFIFVLDTNKRPLTPCKPSMARKLLTAGESGCFQNVPNHNYPQKGGNSND